jgi:hypothetical protein
MKVHPFFIAVAAVMSGICLPLRAQPDGKQIMTKSQDAMKLSGSESVATLIIADNKGNQRVRTFTSASKTDNAASVNKTIMRFLEPADVRGTGILTFDYDNKDDDMWLYLPALRKVRRVVSTDKNSSFMGSEFTNADITTPDIAKYKYAVLGSETVAEVDCWKIEIYPVSDAVAEEYGYAKKICWVGKQDFMARKSEFFDLDKQLSKVLTVNKVKLLDEKAQKYQATDIVMENTINNRKSQFIIDQIVLNPDVKEEYFTTGYLEKQ